jgi:hypothetical protein
MREMRLRDVVGLVVATLLLLATIAFASWLAHQTELGDFGRNVLIGIIVVPATAAFMAFVLRIDLRTEKQREAAAQRWIAESRANHEALLAKRRAQLEADPVRRRYLRFVDEGMLISDHEIDRREARIASLAGHPEPLRTRYAELAFQGILYGDAQIAYLEDPAARVLCEHLVAMEGDARAADPRAVRLEAHRGVITSCTVDERAARAHYRLPDTVVAEYDHPREGDGLSLRCTTCAADLHAQQADARGAQLPPG